VLAATQRLRHSADFAVAIRGGRRATRGGLVVHLSIPAQPGSQHLVEPASAGSIASPASAGFVVSRAGFVVSKAVGNAVVRNTVRRRLRHLIRDRLADLPAGSTIVIRALPAAATAPSSALAVDLDAAIAAARAPRRPRAARVESR
jgi:ribonuclease P protein component